MTTSKKYRYLDWWQGDICLKYDYMIPKDKKIKAPILVSWDDIKQTDVSKIKVRQKNIFNTSVNTLLKNWKKDFKEKYKNSKEQIILYNHEFEKFYSILYGPLPHNHTNWSIKWKLKLTNETLWEIKNYIDNTKVNGYPLEFDFVHSPNCLYINKIIFLDLVYAECCWIYLKWLELTFEPEKNKSEALNLPSVKPAATEISKTTTEDEKVPNNPFPNIFKNGYAYNMFLELKIMTVAEKTKVADYSFIYHNMKNPKLKAIYTSITQPVFIDFLNENYSTNIVDIKLPFKNPQKKQVPYAAILAKHVKDILNN